MLLRPTIVVGDRDAVDLGHGEVLLDFLGAGVARLHDGVESARDEGAAGCCADESRAAEGGGDYSAGKHCWTG